MIELEKKLYSDINVCREEKRERERERERSKIIPFREAIIFCCWLGGRNRSQLA